jgi:hypothetical protein
MTEAHRTEHVKRPKTNGDALTVSGLSALFTQWMSDMERFIDERDRRYDERATAETDRINALFTANATAVNLANTRAEGTAVVLAARFDKSAEALAARVESTAAAAKTAADAVTAALVGRIAPLERAVIEIAAVKTQRQGDKTQSNWTISQVITVGAVFAGIAYEALSRAKP